MTESSRTNSTHAASLNLQSIIAALQLKLLTHPNDLQAVRPTSVYASDLLSCVMTGARSSGIWITLQSHNNIVAVAALLELAAVIITEGAQPDPQVIENANQQGVCLLQTEQKTYEIAGHLWELGLPG